MIEKVLSSKRKKASKSYDCDASYMIREEYNGSTDTLERWKELIPKRFHKLFENIATTPENKIGKGETYIRTTLLSFEYGGHLILHEKPEARKLLNYLCKAGWIEPYN